MRQQKQPWQKHRADHAMLERGVYPPPAQFEAAFLSLAHGDTEIDETLRAAADAFRAVAAA